MNFPGTNDTFISAKLILSFKKTILKNQGDYDINCHSKSNVHRPVVLFWQQSSVSCFAWFA